MKHVRFIGDPSDFPFGVKTAHMNDDGLVQLDGPKDMWRQPSRYANRHPYSLCYGWHDIPEWRALWVPSNYHALADGIR